VSVRPAPPLQLFHVLVIAMSYPRPVPTRMAEARSLLADAVREAKESAAAQSAAAVAYQEWLERKREIEAELLRARERAQTAQEELRIAQRNLHLAAQIDSAADIAQHFGALELRLIRGEKP